MSEQAVLLRSEPRRRLYDWIKAVAVALAAGPAIGGLVFGIMLSVMNVSEGLDALIYAPVRVIGAMIVSYSIGLPIATLATFMFLLSSRLIPRGTAVLAVVCGVAATAIFIIANEMLRRPIPSALQLGLGDFLLQLAAFGIPSAVAGWACWQITKPLHRLS